MPVRGRGLAGDVASGRGGAVVPVTGATTVLPLLSLLRTELSPAGDARDWAAEKTNHPREVIEAALAHVVPNKVEAAYARSDLFERRRLLMDDWAEYVGGGHRSAAAPPAQECSAFG